MTISAVTAASTDRAINALDGLVSSGRGMGVFDAEPSVDAIVLSDLTKTYGDGTEAVRGISLNVRAGESYGMLGPNGAGKSTTLGMVGTLIRPTGGSAFVAGLDVVADRRAVRRRIGFAMQQAGVDEFATPLELLVLQARLHGVPKGEARRRARLLLRLIDLEDLAHKRLATFSGGMRRRVDLASALVHMPPIVLLDEPTEGLDPRSRAAMWDTLDQLRLELGVTLILSTHYMEEADRLCDRIGIFDRGGLVAEGTPASLKATVGSQSLVIRFAPGASARGVGAARSTLLARGDVRDVLVAERTLSVLVDDAAGLAPRILRAVESDGIAPRSVEITEPTLEDVYLRYTGRAFETPSADETDGLRRAA
jgi:ABC-2 type transport system ATP-binding protein